MSGTGEPALRVLYLSPDQHARVTWPRLPCRRRTRVGLVLEECEVECGLMCLNTGRSSGRDYLSSILGCDHPGKCIGTHGDHMENYVISAVSPVFKSLSMSGVEGCFKADSSPLTSTLSPSSRFVLTPSVHAPLLTVAHASSSWFRPSPTLLTPHVPSSRCLHPHPPPSPRRDHCLTSLRQRSPQSRHTTQRSSAGEPRE